jgi:tricorn protease
MDEFIDKKYDQWVEERRKMVDELSGGRLAYLHIRGMSQPNLDQFEQELYSIAHGKEGLIIDVRDNGGGWTTDMMLAILNVRDYAYTIPRDGGKGYPQDRLPFYAWTKPAAALCNEHSFSNAEIFAHAFKTLGRGPLIGQTTFGGVISAGSDDLIDGTHIRIPSRGWYVKDTGINMELHGAVPDYIVPHTPTDEVNNQDAQLTKAVEVLMEMVNEEVGK